MTRSAAHLSVFAPQLGVQCPAKDLNRSQTTKIHKELEDYPGCAFETGAVGLARVNTLDRYFPTRAGDGR